MRIIPMMRTGCCVVVTVAVLAGAGGAAEQVGVPNCDAFLTRYEACINTKMPQNVRALHQKEVDQWRKRWIEAGTKDPSFKSSPLGLGEVCKNTQTLATPMVEVFGCSFQ
jgi:hypothetical protein